MNQAEVTKLVSKLKIKVNPRLRKFRNPLGPEERLNKLRKTVTALIKHERIELNFARANESRMYAERLISDAIRYGDCHKTTMEMADYWLTEKQVIHKLFKVLVSRYENYNIAYTRLVKAPKLNGETRERAVLELRGNPYPSLWPENNSSRDLLHNVLLDEAKKVYRMEKYKEIAAKVEENIKDSNKSLAGAEKANVDKKTTEMGTEKANVYKKTTEVGTENEKVEIKDKENV